MALAELSRRPLKDRQRECDDRLQRDVHPKLYETFQKSMSHEMLKWEILPVLLKRELWELYWSVFRDTIEERAEKSLVQMEKASTEKKTIFD